MNFTRLYCILHSQVKLELNLSIRWSMQYLVSLRAAVVAIQHRCCSQFYTLYWSNTSECILEASSGHPLSWQWIVDIRRQKNSVIKTLQFGFQTFHCFAKQSILPANLADDKINQSCNQYVHNQLSCKLYSVFGFNLSFLGESTFQVDVKLTV